MNRSQYFCLALILILSACQKYKVNVVSEKLSKFNLASTFVGSPDPRQFDPPKGERLVVKWQIPRSLELTDIKLKLDVIYNDLTSHTLTSNIKSCRDSFMYELTKEAYLSKKGLLSYKASIVTSSGEILYDWSHFLYTDIIKAE